MRPRDAGRPPVHREVREVEIAEHLWSAFDELAACMATDRVSLINQAMFVFARLNGCFDHKASAEAQLPANARLSPRFEGAEPAAEGDRDADERAARVLRVADQLQKQLQAVGDRDQPDEAPEIDVEPDVPQPAVSEASEVAGLYIQTDGAASERVAKPRFIIGRGKTCELVIDSGKVSRQHAAIIREGADYFIEDLKSANGTWFDGRRLTTRRKIESGDEYSICNVKIRLVIIP